MSDAEAFDPVAAHPYTEVAGGGFRVTSGTLERLKRAARDRCTVTLDDGTTGVLVWVGRDTHRAKVFHPSTTDPTRGRHRWVPASSIVEADRTAPVPIERQAT